MFLSVIQRVSSYLLAAVVILMATQVILRFGFNAPKAWAEEVDRYLFVWSVYLGSIIAMTKGTHIRVLFVVEWGGPRFEKASQRIGRIISILSFALVAYYGYGLAWDNRNSTFYTLDFMPQVIFYLSVPVCMTIMVLYLLAPRRK